MHTRAAFLESEDEHDACSEIQGRTCVVELLKRDLARVRSLGPGEAYERHDSNSTRDVEEEAPSPGGLCCDDTAQDGTEDRRQGEDDTNQPTHETELFLWRNFRDCGHGDREQARGADALQGTESDELCERLR